MVLASQRKPYFSRGFFEATRQYRPSVNRAIVGRSNVSVRILRKRACRCASVIFLSRDLKVFAPAARMKSSALAAMALPEISEIGRAHG